MHSPLLQLSATFTELHLVLVTEEGLSVNILLRVLAVQHSRGVNPLPSRIDITFTQKSYIWPSLNNKRKKKMFEPPCLHLWFPLCAAQVDGPLPPSESCRPRSPLSGGRSRSSGTRHYEHYLALFHMIPGITNWSPEGNIDSGAEKVNGHCVNGAVPVQDHQQQLGSLGGHIKGRGSIENILYLHHLRYALQHKYTYCQIQFPNTAFLETCLYFKSTSFIYVKLFL